MWSNDLFSSIKTTTLLHRSQAAAVSHRHTLPWDPSGFP